MIDEKQLLVDSLNRLNESGLEYVLTGSMASNYWGVPRMTHDLDFVILHKLYWHKITPSDRQLGDVAGVFSTQKASLDRDYMRHWAEKLGVADVLQDVLDGRLRPKST